MSDQIFRFVVLRNFTTTEMDQFSKLVLALRRQMKIRDRAGLQFEANSTGISYSRPGNGITRPRFNLLVTNQALQATSFPPRQMHDIAFEELKFVAVVLVLAVQFFGPEKIKFINLMRHEAKKVNDEYIAFALNVLSRPNMKALMSSYKPVAISVATGTRLMELNEKRKAKIPEFLYQQICKKLAKQLSMADILELHHLAKKFDLQIDQQDARLLNNATDLRTMKSVYCKMLAKHFYRSPEEAQGILNLEAGDQNLYYDREVRDLPKNLTHIAERTLPNGRVQRKAYEAYELRDRMNTSEIGDRSFDLTFDAILKDKIEKQIKEYEALTHRIYHR